MNALTALSGQPTDTAVALPPTNLGFKDWAIICAALGGGRQSLILRKGGIAEGRDGFRFKHERFFLFPTGFHQQTDKVRGGELDLPSLLPVTKGTQIEIRYFFALEYAEWVDDWDRVARLEPFHAWKEEVVRERFDYGDERGLQCAFGRVYCCDPVWTFPDRPAYGGCRSWVNLPQPPADLKLSPVLDEGEHSHRLQAIKDLLRPA